MNDKIEIYLGGLVRRKWRWRYVHANGHILADSGQGYSRRIDALNGVKAVTGLRDGNPGYLIGGRVTGGYRSVRLIDL